MARDRADRRRPVSWHLERLTCFDLESTGPDPQTARIVEAYVGMVGGGEPTIDLVSVLVNPGVPIPDEAAKVHGYTTAYVREHGQDWTDSVELIAARLATALAAEMPIVGHNVGWDLTVIERECERAGLATVADRLEGPVRPVIDTKILSKHVDPYRRRVSAEQGAHVLKTCAQVFGIGWDDQNAHGARFDALTSGRVAWRMGAIAALPKQQRPKLASKASRDLFDDLAVPLNDLHVRQARWATEQAASYAEHLRKKADSARTADEQEALLNQAVSITGDWPVSPRRQEATV